ncbi:MAG: hypothetical protein U5M50_11020 [Sphingobium sp.]|nr:hypothetical protein [Sphingobium sp.]
MSDRIQDRMDLYKEGLNDAEIARIQGVDPSAVCHWRRANGLKRHAGSGREKLAVSVGRRFLYGLKWSDKSIARQQQVTPQSVRGWRQHHGLSPNRPAGRNQRRAKQEQLHELQRRVVRAIGTRLPFDIAADAAADLMLAVVEGRVPLDQIEKHGRAFGNRALDQYANSFRQSSLDEDIPNAEGLRKIDMLVDEGSSAWLEEMGATCH